MLTAIEKLKELSPAQLACMPTEQLAAMANAVEALKTLTKNVDERLTTALDMRYGAAARLRRLANGKDQGRVHLKDEGFNITADLPKRVEWDQNKLADVVAKIEEAGDNPAEYVKTVYEVSERAYTAWPASIRKVFEPARTVKNGKPKYTITATPTLDVA